MVADLSSQFTGKRACSLIEKKTAEQQMVSKSSCLGGVLGGRGLDMPADR